MSLKSIAQILNGDIVFFFIVLYNYYYNVTADYRELRNFIFRKKCQSVSSDLNLLLVLLRRNKSIHSEQIQLSSLKEKYTYYVCADPEAGGTGDPDSLKKA